MSWAFMMGPMTYFNHLISGPRLPFTTAYFGSIGLTLYFSLGVSNSFHQGCLTDFADALYSSEVYL